MGDRASFTVAVDQGEQSVVVRVEGELDLASAPELEAALTAVVAAPHVVFDLSGCTFLDSAGVGVIHATIGQATRVSVIATDPGVLRVLEITAVDTMIPVHASLEEAL